MCLTREKVVASRKDCDNNDIKTNEKKSQNYDRYYSNNILFIRDGFKSQKIFNLSLKSFFIVRKFIVYTESYGWKVAFEEIFRKESSSLFLLNCLSFIILCCNMCLSFGFYFHCINNFILKRI